MFEIFITGLVAFISTNVDDIVILSILFASVYHVRNIVLGQFLGIGVLMVGSICIAVISMKYGYLIGIDGPQIGILGFVPILIGLTTVLNPHLLEEGDEIELDDRAKGLRQIIAVTSLTVANGGDNLGIYVPFFISLSYGELWLIGIIFTVMTGVWCWLGYNLSKYSGVGDITEKTHIILPFILIGLGTYVLWTNGTIKWLSRFLG